MTANPSSDMAKSSDPLTHSTLDPGLFAEAVQIIRGAKSIGLACHVNPDGDALGSMLGMYWALMADGIGERVPIHLSFPAPLVANGGLRYLPGLDVCELPGDFPKNLDVAMTFDAASPDRLAELEPRILAAQQVIVVDHHVTNPGFGTLNLIDPKAAATGVVVARLIEALGVDFAPDMATCVYTALVHDTGSFQYPNTTAHDFDLAGKLVRAGADMAMVAKNMQREMPLSYIEFCAEKLADVKLDEESGLVSLFVTKDDLTRHGLDFEAAEGLLYMLRRVKEARVACLIKEREYGHESGQHHAHKKGVKVSLRSRGDIDVAAIAGQLGGGGHKAAAGFSAKSADEVLSALKSLLGAAESSDETQEGTS